jgi:hypothetical protein
MKRMTLMLAVLTLLLGGKELSADQITQVDFSNQANFTWGGLDQIPAPGEPVAVHLPGAPVGVTTLGGIPFNIISNADGKEAWAAGVAAAGGDSVVSITMNENVFGATNVYTLINTWWGTPGTYASLIFTGSGGAIYTKDLVGNSDIRDYNQATWLNSINGTTTTQVFDGISNWGAQGRLDMQHIALPGEFASQSLISIQLVDSGRSGFQRTVLDGVTIFSNDVQSAPVPSSLSLLGIGALCLAVGRRRLWPNA